MSLNSANLPNHRAGQLVAPVWKKYTLTYADFTAEATTDTVALTQPANTVVHAARIKQTTAFAGSSTVTLQVGISGTADKFVGAHNVKTTPSATSFKEAAVYYAESTAPWDVYVTCTTGDSNCDDLTAGVADIYLLVSEL